VVHTDIKIFINVDILDRLSFGRITIYGEYPLLIFFEDKQAILV